MKRSITIVGLFLVFALFTASAQSQDGKPKVEIHVLFIGNSFTYYHDLPKMISELAKAGKQRPML